MTSHREISLNGGVETISNACGIESVIQNVSMSISLEDFVKFSHDLQGNTACVTYILILAAPALLIACSIKTSVDIHE